MEQIYIRLIEAGIRGLNQGTKTPEETKAPKCLNLLKEINEPMYEHLLEKWQAAVIKHSLKNL